VGNAGSKFVLSAGPALLQFAGGMHIPLMITFPFPIRTTALVAALLVFSLRSLGADFFLFTSFRGNGEDGLHLRRD